MLAGQQALDWNDRGSNTPAPVWRASARGRFCRCAQAEACSYYLVHITPCLRLSAVCECCMLDRKKLFVLIIVGVCCWDV